MALEPVFSSEDIIQQMPKEGRIFRQVDKMWEKLMGKIASDPNALVVVAIDDLGKTLRSCDEKLGEVQKGLSEYLGEKRKAFPRFYFLSDDELLEILSETKDPLRVQPHLKKCFEGIQKLEFDEEKKIHAMISVEGERVPMERVIDPMAAKGMVEVWLLQVEDCMIKSVRAVIESSLKEYTKMPRDKWIVSFCGQAVLCISQLFWTQTTEEMMQKGGLQGLQQHYQKLREQLMSTVNVVRNPGLSGLDRCTLEALIVLDVHAQDVIKEELIDEGKCSATDYAWLQ